VYRLPDLFDGGQVDVAVQQRAGVHVVEQRGDQALRRGPAVLPRGGGAGGGAGGTGGGGVGNPGGAPTPSAVRGVLGVHDLRRRGQDWAGGDRLHPDGPGVAVREHLRGHGDVDAGAGGRQRQVGVHGDGAVEDPGLVVAGARDVLLLLAADL